MTEYRTIELDNGELEVLRGKAGNPPSYEVVARFYDKEAAVRYANQLNLPQAIKERVVNAPKHSVNAKRPPVNTNGAKPRPSASA